MDGPIYVVSNIHAYVDPCREKSFFFLRLYVHVAVTKYL